MIPHLSLHPHAFISLPTYFMSPTCSPSASLFLSLSLLCLPFFFSTDNRQSSHAVNLLCFWRRPSESPNTLFPSLSFSLSKLKSYSGLSPSFFHPASPSFFLSSVIVCSCEYTSLNFCLAGLQFFSSKLHLITSCHSSSVQCMFSTFFMT